MSLCVIDADLIAFKASAACETRWVRATHKASGRSKEFGTATMFRKWLADNPKWEESEFDLSLERDVEPLANCLHTVKAMVNRIYLGSKCREFKLVIGGKGNFRDDLPLPTKYKARRENLVKPELHAEAVDFLKRKYKAEEANGWEADDLLSAYAWEGYTKNKRIVAATIDKDARQQMGWLYDYDKMEEPIFIEGLGKLYRDERGKVSGHGRKWLYFQWISGDPSDCYKPSEVAGVRWGDVSSFNHLKDCSTDRECIQAVHSLYKKWYPDGAKYKSWDGKDMSLSHVDMMQMYLDCCRMMRYKGDKVSVKDMLKRMGILSTTPH